MDCPNFNKCKENCYQIAPLLYLKGKPNTLVLRGNPSKHDKQNKSMLSNKDSDYVKFFLNWSDYCNITYGVKPSFLYATLYNRKGKPCITYINYLIKKYGIKHIVCLDETSFKVLKPDITIKSSYDYVRHVNSLYKYKNCNLIATIQLKDIVTAKDKEVLSFYSMYAHLFLKCAFDFFPRIESKIENYIYVDNIKKLKDLHNDLKKADIIAIDTETTSLAKRYSQLLTLQIAVSKDKAYFIPFKHSKANISQDLRKSIYNMFHKFFKEKPFKNIKTTIFVNASFDIKVLRTAFNFNYYPYNIWDIPIGEYLLNGDIAEVAKKWKKSKFRTLQKLAENYGYFGFEEGFGKEQRTTIKDINITKDLIEYGVKDVLIPYRIFYKQLKFAKLLKMKESFVNLMNNLVTYTMNSISELEYQGILIDKRELENLMSKTKSPIVIEMNKLLHKFFNSKNVTKAITRINKNKKSGLFGDIDNKNLFNINSTVHKQVLFYDVMKLKPIKGKKTTGKDFQEQYSKVEEVKLLSEYTKLYKLYTSFIESFYNKLLEDEDSNKDGRIRANFHSDRTLSGRLASSDPNFQQIPSHGNLAKIFKKIFIVKEGYVYVKLDYMAAEVRGLGIVARDEVLAKDFIIGYKLRQQYRKNPTEELAKRIKLEGDIHRINSSFFFGIPIEEIDKDIRQAVKAVTFGLIYGRSVKSIAEAIGKSPKEVKELITKFFNKYVKSKRWLDNTMKFAVRNKYTVSPLGRRRWLYGILTGNNSLISASERRAVNSPIQSLCADFSMIAINLLLKNREKFGYDFKVINSTHDSAELEVRLDQLRDVLKLTEWCFTKGVAKVIEEQFNFKMIIPLEVEFEIGKSLDTLQEWDFTEEGFTKILKEVS